jgi:hypothetical protein
MTLTKAKPGKKASPKKKALKKKAPPLAPPAVQKIKGSAPSLTRTQAAIRAEQLAMAQAEAMASKIIARYKTAEELETAMGRFLDVFAAVALRIRTKQGGPLWPFALNPIQIDYMEGLRKLFTGGAGDLFRGIRDLIVKPRQLGFSTFIAALYFMDGFLEPGRITVIVSHDDKISQELLRTYKLFYDELPDELKQGVSLSKAATNIYELEFDGQPEKSRFEIRTEKGNPWRGGVIHNLHASEAAFYDNYANFMASYVQAVPATGNIIFESTCNGKNEFYEEVMQAEEGASVYRIIFYTWFMHPEYRVKWDDNQPPPSKERPTPNELSEVEAMKVYGLDLDQLAWRRAKQKELKSTFPQEYPETLLGAFLATGRAFFEPHAVNLGLEGAKLWNKTHKFREPRGFVRIFEEPIPGETYVLGADVAEGIDMGESVGDKGGTDFNSAYVVHMRTMRTVARVHGRFPPLEYARIIDRLGRLYRAVAGVERNNHGHTVLMALQQFEYPALYHHVEYNQSNQRYLKPGFPTTSTTRPVILDALEEVIREGTHSCPDERFWREADRFVRNKKTGKPEAMEGWHDDTIIGKAIAIYLCTIGRNGWGLEGAPGSDSAGFPKPEPLPPIPSEVAAHAAASTPPVDTPSKSFDLPQDSGGKSGLVETPSLASRLRALREETAAAPVHLKDIAAAPAEGIPTGRGGSLVSGSAVVGQAVGEALSAHSLRKLKTCDLCEHYRPDAPGLPGQAWCSRLFLKLAPKDPGCNLWSEVIVEDEDATLDADVSGGEAWK